MKKIGSLILVMLALTSFSLFAKQAVYNTGDDYDIEVRYEDNPCPGDPLFVRMIINQAGKKNKVSKQEFIETKARLQLYAAGKVARTSDFYLLQKANQSQMVMLAGVPLSSWWTKDTPCSLKVIYSLYGKKNLEFELPLTLKNKDFVSETIELNPTNTSIKTDTSTKRMEQINKLNGILGTINPSAVYQTERFMAPTSATRRTSFFADRRVYKYTNGKSSTSLHYGIDYGVPTGTQVNACAAGKVVLAETRVTTGWSVVIEHLPGLYSLYYHMSELKVKEGDMVKQGDLIGLSGATGLATGPHLHWEMRLNSEAVSPDAFVDSDFAFAGNK